MEANSAQQQPIARSPGGRGRLATVLCGLAAVLSVSACAPSSLLDYRQDDVATVTLPLALAGVHDERAAFAALFAEELVAVAPVGADGAAVWLHGNADPGAVPPGALDATRARFAARAGATSVLILPGLFGDCVSAQAVPFGDGVLRTAERSPVEAYRQYQDLGLFALRMAPLPGRASCEANGERLAALIRSEAASPDVERIVLVGYSKGLPDGLHALAILQREDQGLAKVAALVSVAGTVIGTPLADYFRNPYDTLSPWFNPLDCTDTQGGELASITRRERVAWLAANPPPASLAYYSIVAHAPREQMAPALSVTGDWLARVNPRNDGQVVASDAILPGSTLLAEVRSDHWDLALPINRSPHLWMRALASGRDFPREALLRATLIWVLGHDRDSGASPPAPARIRADSR